MRYNLIHKIDLEEGLCKRKKIRIDLTCGNVMNIAKYEMIIPMSYNETERAY